MHNPSPHPLRFFPLLMALSLATPRIAQADEADKLILDTMQRQQVPGATVAVVHKGKVLKAQGYGLCNIELQVPAQRETVYQSASLGKQFTAAAVMMLVEDGKIKLDERVHTYLPDTPASWKGTVRQLLTHTSGMAEITDATDLRRDYNEDELLKLLFKARPDFEPGAAFKYSNSGYVTLGIVISKITGHHYSKFLEQRIFKPLGMKTARLISEADIIPNRAAGYRLTKGGLKNQEWVSPTFNSTADGALYLTVDDLIKWDAALYGDAPLKKDSLQQMWTPAKTSDGKRTKYGFGWFVESVNDHQVVHHTGNWQGFTSCIRRYPDNQLMIIVLMNLAGPEQQGKPGAVPQELAVRLAEIYEPDLKSTSSDKRPSERQTKDPDKSKPIVSQKSLPQKKWPRDLNNMLDALRKQHASPATIEVRYTDPEDYSNGFYWRMPANAATIEAHIKTFQLKKSTAKAYETSKMFERYPQSWPKPAAKDVTWYAWDGNRDDEAVHAHFWQIMMIDERQGILYFFYWIWDVGI